MQVAEARDDDGAVEARRALLKRARRAERVEELAARGELEQQVHVVGGAEDAVEHDDKGVVARAEQSALVEHLPLLAHLIAAVTSNQK